MSAAAQTTQFDPVLWAIADAERELADLYHYCERLHRANIAHEGHSCVLCFEQR